MARGDTPSSIRRVGAPSRYISHVDDVPPVHSTAGVLLSTVVVGMLTWRSLARRRQLQDAVVGVAECGGSCSAP
jgi:hypothetical protein